MATGPYVLTNVVDSVQTVYNGALANTFNDQSPSIVRLNQAGNVEYNVAVERITWPAVKSPHNDASTIPDGGTLPDASVEQLKKAVLDFKIYIEIIRVGRKLLRGSISPVEYFRTAEGADLIARELNRALPIVARTMHKHIVNMGSTASANNITSLGDAVGNNSNTYAGIDRTTETYWQPYVNSNAGVPRNVTRALMEDMVNNIIDTRGGNPTEVWAGTTAWNAIRNLINTEYPGRNIEPRKLEGGALEIYWENIPIIRMPQMDANDTAWLDMISDGGIKLKFQHESDFLFQEESTGSYDKRWSVAAHAELVINNPWKQGSLQDLQ